MLLQLTLSSQAERRTLIVAALLIVLGVTVIVLAALATAAV